MSRIHLSPPDMSATERELLLAAFDANWVAPAGPDLAAFENEFCSAIGVDHAVALSSGTAALHLALMLVGVGVGDRVLVPTFTFAATANAVTYVGAEPVFVDSERSTWNIDPALVSESLDRAAAVGNPFKAVVTVDLYGQCADHQPILDACRRHRIPLIEDAAEAIGATWQGRPAGTFGDISVFSFNGNKAMTTGGGGMLVSSDPDLVDRARHLSTQAREPAVHYEHREVGYNYRLSNLLAAIGRGQLRRPPRMIERRGEIRAAYTTAFADVPDIGFNPIDPRGRSNNWLTVVVLPESEPHLPEKLITALAAADIEARPAWKPMHMQPVFTDREFIGADVASTAFARGVCLPSGSGMSESDVERVIAAALPVLTDG